MPMYGIMEYIWRRSSKADLFGSIVKALTRDPVQELRRVIANVDDSDVPKYRDYASILYCIYGTVPITTILKSTAKAQSE